MIGHSRRSKRPQTKLKRAVTSLLTLASLGAILALLVHCSPSAPTYRQPQELIGKKAPSLEAHTVSRVESSAERCTLRVLWATWCEPCKTELPALDDWLRHSDIAANVELVLADDAPDEEVARFLQTHEVAYGSYTQQPEALSQHGIRGVPTAFVIDAEGVVAATHEGSLTQASLDALFETARCSPDSE